MKKPIETTDNAGHSHTISNSSTGFTDVTNGHRHKLSTGCKSCDRIRKKTFKGKMMTTMSKGHFHFFKPEQE